MQRDFVCVRILRMNDVDLALFQFDYDLSWMAFFLNADAHVYSRYGGRDATSDDGRLSIAGLKMTMRRVLEQHRISDQPVRQPHVPKVPSKLFAVNAKQCLHCHQVWEGMRDAQRREGTFQPESLHVYPLPENIGLVLDVDLGNRVRFVWSGSAAARAGLRAGDNLQRVGDVPVLSQADVSWALHNAPAQGSLGIEYTRDGHRCDATVSLRRLAKDGWELAEVDASRVAIP